VAYSLELAEEWHPTKNVKFQRDEVPYNSSYRAWWRCKRDDRHEWPAIVATRAIDKQGCPFCSGRKVLPEDSIAELYPDVAAEFHPTKNGDLRPEEFAPQSNIRLWWLCSRDSSHEWETAVANRTNGSRCRDCRRIEKSLARTAPEIAAEWHPTKNGDLTPEMVSSSSEEKVWWQCRVHSEHEWKSSVATRKRRDGKCPKCRQASKNADSRTAGKFSARRGLDETAPDLLTFWHPTKNGRLRPSDVSHGSSREVWWQCPENSDHSWKESIERVNGRKKICRQCPGGRNPGTVSLEKSLGHLHPKLLTEWHPTLNVGLDPMSLAPGSRRKAFWQCESNPEHVWDAHVFRRTKGSKCPFCSGLRADSKTCLAAVDAEIAATWHPTKNGDVTPANVTRQSATKRWWLCDVNPEHVWSQSVQNRVNRRQCPQCNKLARQGKLESALARSISENVSSYATFSDSIDSLSRLALLESPDAALQQVLYRQVYAGVVASMETYLSDTFINTVVGNKTLRNRFARSTTDFADRKYKLDEVIDWERNSQTIIKKHLVDQVFHNLEKVGPLFIKVLKVKFPTGEAFADLLRIVNARHNIVHRNGRTKKGQVVALSVPDIDSAISQVRQFVEDIDCQVARTPWKRRRSVKPR
tara:strand:- start:116915 stop:118834 length:1920 start_codon:yes stop_codon:yes gene_type:complete